MYYIPIKDGYEIITSLDNILIIEAKRNYTLFIFNDREPVLSSYNLGKLSKKLLSNSFIKVSRSLIINKVHVLRYCKSDNCVELKNKLKIKLCRKKTHEILDLMGVESVFAI